MNWYIGAWRKFAVFAGRARRAEYWYFVLYNVLVSAAFMIFDKMTGTFDPETGSGLMSWIYSLAILIPGTSVTVRRLHDTGRSAWWLAAFSAVIALCLGYFKTFQESGWVSVILALLVMITATMLIFLIQRGQPGDNAYGPDPLGEKQFSRASGRPDSHEGSDVQASQDPIDRLERLASLRDRGILSEEEFLEQKEKILNSNNDR